jgi:hypothetical protein
MLCFQTLSKAVKSGSTQLGFSEEELIRRWLIFREQVKGWATIFIPELPLIQI